MCATAAAVLLRCSVSSIRLTWFGDAASRGRCSGFPPDHQRGQGAATTQLPHALLPALHLGLLYRGALGGETGGIIKKCRCFHPPKKILRY